MSILARSIAVHPWLRPLPFALALSVAGACAARSDVDGAPASGAEALAKAIAARGLAATAEDVTWLEGPSGVVGTITGARRNALVRAAADGEPADLYLVGARVSPEGQVLDVDDPIDLTKTSGVDEGRPLLRGDIAAYVTSLDGAPTAVHVLDFGGYPAAAYKDLSRVERAQTRITHAQTTGQSRGVVHHSFTLDPAPTRVTLAFDDDGMLEVRGDGATQVIDPRRAVVVSGAGVRVTEGLLAKPPGLSAWASDRLRGASWFGDDKNQLLKMAVFTAMEWVKTTKSRVTGDTGEKDVASDLGSLTAAAPPPTFRDPEVGWPPEPIEPVIKPSLKGEGQWIALSNDPFIHDALTGDAAAPFMTTFVRTDKNAQHTRIYVTMWDPRVVELHMEAGTVEPTSATGEPGPGIVPRTPEVFSRLVAGFNGGFQATHGEYGMQANGVLYLPPKPYAATVMQLRDGSTAFGSWPGPGVVKGADGTEKPATMAPGPWSSVPAEVLSFRQNMTALIENGKFNPRGRTWWGGVPPGWKDAVHTTRSGICLTKEGWVAYFFGNDISAEPLAKGMLAARCTYGIHLDMNPGLVGFEFYHVEPASTFTPLSRPLQNDWEYEGGMKDLPDLRYRARRMIKSMGHMFFPRYVQRDARDFFYLTARNVLPGAPLPSRDGKAAWRVKGLPQHGFPYALAVGDTSFAADGAPPVAMKVLKLDPRMFHIARDGDDAPTVCVLGGAGRRDAGSPKQPDTARSIWLTAHTLTMGRAAPTESSRAIAQVVEGTNARARGAAGIADADGMLLWVELPAEVPSSGAASAAMLALLERAGCSSRGLLPDGARAYPGGALDIGLAPARAEGVRLARSPGPGGRPYFESTEIVGPSVWHPLMSQRVRYFPKPKVAPPADAGNK